MPIFNVTWESWERGSVEIEASDTNEVEKIFDEEYVGCLEADSEGLDIVEIEEMTDSGENHQEDADPSAGGLHDRPKMTVGETST
jgi:hypothetical protein